MAYSPVPQGSHRFNLNLPKDLYERVQAEGAVQERPSSWIFRVALEEYLARQAALRAEGRS